MKLFVWIVTVIWTVAVIGFPFSGILSVEHPNHLNEWGDYLAGAFSPLAFLWLIMGYKQQGEELKQNTDALRLQAQELQNSVAEQKKSVTQQEALVESTKVELNMLAQQHQDNQQNVMKQFEEQKLRDEQNTLPVLQFEYTEQKFFNECFIINIGAPIISLEFIKVVNINNITPYMAVLKTSSIQTDKKIDLQKLDMSLESEFDVIFKTSQGIRYKQSFLVNKWVLGVGVIISSKDTADRIYEVDC